MPLNRIEGLRLLLGADGAMAEALSAVGSMKSAWETLVEVDSPFNFRLRSSAANWIVHHFFRGTAVDSPYEFPLLFALFAATGSGGTFLDIGANVGYHTLAVWKNTPASLDIHAFEPMPLFYKRLEQNVALNGAKSAVQIHTTALSDHDGESTLYVFGVLSSLELSWLSDAGLSEQEQITVPVRRLDGLLDADQLNGPIVAKIDVEGHELAVLEGGRRLFQSEKTNTLVIESDLRSGNVELLHSRLREWGYRLFGLYPRVSDQAELEIYRPPFLPVETSDLQNGETNAWLAVRWEDPTVQSWWELWRLYPWFAATRWMKRSTLARWVSERTRQSRKLAARLRAAEKANS